MKSFVIRLEDLFLMDTKAESPNFVQSKRRLMIPAYQREFKWEDERIESLLSDIARNSKFFGNIILDETADKYEVIDGQQRLTTICLILVCLYNHYKGHRMEQQTILGFLKPSTHFFLENESVGDYLSISDGECTLCISPSSDIYEQKSDFTHALELISEFISKLSSNDQVADFKQKLLDSQVLVLINDLHDRSHPVEQVFLDINEKAQRLEPEDIFKGHCFKQFDKTMYDELKKKWVSLKKASEQFKRYGFSDTSEYIYTYLLETDNASLPKNLSSGGKHYLDGKTMDETDALLLAMIRFGDNVNRFYEELSQEDYRFEDICPDSKKYRNTNDHISLKAMSKGMLDLKSAVYQKIPFCHLINALYINEIFRNSLTHQQLKKIVSNLYIYTGLFSLRGGRKSKKHIDRSIFIGASSESPVKQIVDAAKNLRKELVSEFIMNESRLVEKTYFMASVIDSYVPESNWLSHIYLSDDSYNIEHFLVPQNDRNIIKWINGENSFDIEIDKAFVRAYLHTDINLLVMDKHLNASIEHNDIIDRIETIKNWYRQRDSLIPRHILSTITFIEGLPEYTALKRAKEDNENCESVKAKYLSFLKEYFSPDNANTNRRRIEELFKSSFANESN